MEKLNVEFSSNTSLFVIYLGRIWNIFILAIWKGSYITWSYTVMTIEWVDLMHTPTIATFVVTHMCTKCLWSHTCWEVELHILLRSCKLKCVKWLMSLYHLYLFSYSPSWVITINRGIIDAPFPKRVGQGYQLCHLMSLHRICVIATPKHSDIFFKSLGKEDS